MLTQRHQCGPEGGESTVTVLKVLSSQVVAAEELLPKWDHTAHVRMNSSVEKLRSMDLEDDR